MNRSQLKWVVLALAALLAAQPGSAGAQTSKTAATSVSPGAAEADREIVKELVEILGSTEAPETFAVTVLALQQLGDLAKPAVPTIIRHAERLKIFEGTNSQVNPNAIPSKKQQLANVVALAIQHLLGGRRAPTVQACWPPLQPPAAATPRPDVP